MGQGAYGVASSTADRATGMAAEDGLALLCTDTVMGDTAGRERLAREVLAFANSL